VVVVEQEDTQVQLENLVPLHSVVERVLLIPVLLEQKTLAVVAVLPPEIVEVEYLLAETVDQD
jgi:hypothetical protein